MGNGRARKVFKDYVVQISHFPEKDNKAQSGWNSLLQITQQISDSGD